MVICLDNWDDIGYDFIFGKPKKIKRSLPEKHINPANTTIEKIGMSDEGEDIYQSKCSICGYTYKSVNRPHLYDCLSDHIRSNHRKGAIFNSHQIKQIKRDFNIMREFYK